MKVALAQMDCVVGGVQTNCEMIAAMVGDAAAQGCEAVWFPELADTGYALSAMREVAGTWPGPAFNVVSDAAEAHGITVGCGLSERVASGDAGEAIYNALAVFGPDGEPVGAYRKTHLFVAEPCDESRCFIPGSETVVVGVGGLMHGLSVCYDLRFPELYRELSTHGAEVLVNTSAWPSARPGHWEVLSRARALENQAYFFGVARVGYDEGVRLNGHSRIVNPRGEVVVEASADRTELLVAEIDPEEVGGFRDAIPALQHRRRDLFA